jgi:plastocyanin
MNRLRGTLIALVALAGCDDHQQQAVVVTSAAATVQVGPNDTLAFVPQTIDIAVGGTVEWTWQSGTHTVTSGTPGSPDGKFCSLPESVSPSTANCTGIAYASTAPHTYAHTFITPGTYPYYCTVHGAAMTGTVVVGAAAISPLPDMATSPAPPTSGAKTVGVTVGPNELLAFAPQTVSINVGDTVTWTWASVRTPHTVTSGTAPRADGVFCSNNGPQTSDDCNRDGYDTVAPFSFSHTFTTTGTFPYFCKVHGAAMTGTVIVQ